MQCWCLEVGVVFWEEEGTGGQDVRDLHLRQATPGRGYSWYDRSGLDPQEGFGGGGSLVQGLVLFCGPNSLCDFFF